MNIKGLILKEFGRIKSDRRTLILIFALPLIIIIIFGLTSKGGPTEYFNVSLITKDSIPTHGNFPSNSSQYDKQFISTFQGNLSQFGLYSWYNATTIKEYNNDFNKCLSLLKNEIIDIFIVIPENFSETIENNNNTYLIYYIDGSNSEATNAIQVAMLGPISEFRLSIGKTANFTTMVPYLEFGVPFWYPQVLNYALSLIVPLVIVGIMMNLACLSIVSEGPLPRMLVTPTTKREIILSKLIANSAIMILQATEIFIVLALFGLYSLGSLFDLFLTFLLLGLSGLSIGLFISVISKTEQMANHLLMMFFIMILMFSGSFFNVESLPIFLQLIINSLPLTHGINLIVNITLKGLPIDLNRVFNLLLISIGFLLMTYIIYSFKKLEV
ncbi:MAG: ABC transporter permease [Candidatus Lokiarchaeota archaeon]